MIFDLFDMIEQADDLKILKEEARALRKIVEAEIIYDTWYKSNVSYDDFMNFLKGHDD